MRVVIDILDLNEFDPVFEEITYSFSFPTMRAHQLIGIVKVTKHKGAVFTHCVMFVDGKCVTYLSILIIDTSKSAL